MRALQRSELRTKVERRLKDFETLGSSSNHNIFKELCFCVLTANFSAERGIAIQEEIGDGFITYTPDKLLSELKRLGYRFPNVRCSHLLKNRRYASTIKEELKKFDSESDTREWVVKHIAGLGFKESSHFLRNIGYKDLAIIDFHIIDILVQNGLIERPKTLTKSRYLQIEQILRDLAKKLKMSLAEIDLYLWYMETGKVLK